MTSRRRSLRTCSPRTRTANGSQSRDSGFLYTSGPDAVVFGGRGTRDCATTDTIASTHLGEIDHKLADLAALRRESAALDALCDGGTGGQCRILEAVAPMQERSEEHTSELQSLMRISYAVFCLKKKQKTDT